MNKNTKFLKKNFNIEAENKNTPITIIKDLNNYHIKEKLSIGTSGSRLKLWLEKDNDIIY